MEEKVQHATHREGLAAGWELERGVLGSLDYFWGILDAHKQSII